MEDRLRDLVITENTEDGLEFADLGNDSNATEYDLCLVGTFVTDRPINFRVMKHRLASLWRPGRGMFVQDLGSKLYLFKFYHHHDVRWVMEGGPWTFDNHLLVLHELQPGEEPSEIPLFFVPFWIQIYNLPACFFTETVGKALANHVGTFLGYDDKNRKTADRPYLRVRSLVDIRQPLKKEKKVKKAGGDWITCTFRYERLPSFCFICGLIGHIDRHCEQFFQTPEEDIVRAWDVSLRALNKRLTNLGGERWLKEEDDGRPMAAERVNAPTTLQAEKKETQNEKGSCQSAGNSNLFLTLRGNYGANKESINGESIGMKTLSNPMESLPNSEEGLEIAEERKRRRGEMHSLGQRISNEPIKPFNITNMETDVEVDDNTERHNISFSSPDKFDSEVETDPKNGKMAGPGVWACQPQ